MRRVTYTLEVMNWGKDESHCSYMASWTGFAYSEEYMALLGTSLDWATLIKVEADQAGTISKSTGPSKFKDKRMCPKWKVIFKNYLSTIPGVNSLLLSYVVRNQADPERTTDLQANFIAENIAYVPPSSAHFQAETRKVHQILKKYFMHRKMFEWSGQLWIPSPTLQWWRQCQTPRCNGRAPLRNIALQEQACVVIQNIST